MKKLLLIIFTFALLALAGCGAEDAHAEIHLKGENALEIAVLVDEPNYAVARIAGAFAAKLGEYTGKTVEVKELSQFGETEGVYGIYVDTVKEDGSNLPSFDVHMSVEEAGAVTWVNAAVETYEENYEFIYGAESAQIIAPDEYWLYFALEDFLRGFKNEEYSVTAGTRTLVGGTVVPEPARLIERTGDVQFLFTEYKMTFAEYYHEAEAPNAILLVDGKKRNTLQGGCTDGENAYYAVYDDDYAIIYKFDLETWELLAVSDVMPTGHSNDITYLPDRNVLLVAGSTPQNGWFGASYVDADTLEYLEEVVMPYSCGGVQYIPELRQYVFQNFYDYNICDENFNLIKNFTCGFARDTDQGLYCDGHYTYDARWGEKDNPSHSGQNHLLIHDMEGNFISHGQIHGDPCDDESENENVFMHNNLFYVGYNNSPCTVNEYVMVPVNMFE